MHIVLGRNSSGKSQWLYDRIKEKMSKERVILIVPEQYTLQAERDLIKGLNAEGIISVEVMSFNRLCYRLLEETGPLQEVPINSLGKAMVLRSILDQCSDDLMVYKDIAKRPGFVDQMSQLISEFKRAGIESRHLESRLTPGQDKTLVERKLRDISHIMMAYDDFMARGYFDEEDRLRMVLDKVEASEFLKGTYLMIDGFDSFSSQEYEIIDHLAGVVEAIYLALTLDYPIEARDSKLFERSLSTFNRLQDIMGKHDRTCNIHTSHSNDRLEDLTCFEQAFFAQPYQVHQGDIEAIELHISSDLYDEVDLLARHIIEQVRDNKRRYKDLAVVTGNIEAYGSIVKRVFDLYQIPYFLDEKVSVLHHPVIQFILSSLRALHSGFKYEDVFRVVKTDLSNLRLEESFDLENYAIAHGLRGKKWLNPIEDEGLDRQRQTLIQPLVDFQGKMKPLKTIKDQVICLYTYLVDQKIEMKLQAWIDSLKAKGAYEAVQETTQVWNTVMEIFDQLVELEGEDQKTIKEFMVILEAGFNEIQLGIIPSSLDQVSVGSIERSKHHGVQALYVLGLNDGVIPKKYSDEGLILEEEKLYLKSRGLDLETDSNQILSRDYFATYVALTKSTDLLCMSYALTDIEGKSLRPSIYVDKLKRVFPGLKATSHLLDQVKPLEAYRDKVHYNHLTQALRASADQKNYDSMWLSVLTWYGKQETWSDKIQSLKDGLFYDNQVKPMGHQAAKDLFNLPLKASVSRLENYAKCPYAHFVRYGLRPEKRKKHELQLPDIGLLFHRTLESFDEWMQDHKRTWHSLEEDEVYTIVEDLVLALVEDYNHYVFQSSHRYEYLIQKLLRVGKRAIWTLVLQIQQGDFEPYAHEIQFALQGGMKTVPPIMIGLDNGEKILLEGRIDRIDLFEKEGQQYVKIIDYKSGNQGFDLSNVYHGLQLQLMVYLNAILDNHDFFKTDLLYPAGVFYFKIDDPLVEAENLEGDKAREAILSQLKMDGMVLKDLSIAQAMDKNLKEMNKSEIIPVTLKKDRSIAAKSKVAENQEFIHLIQHINGVIKEMGQAIHDGNIEIKPFKLKSREGCQMCDYKSICQFETSFGNQYRHLASYKDEEVFEMICEREVENGPVDK